MTTLSSCPWAAALPAGTPPPPMTNLSCGGEGDAPARGRFPRPAALRLLAGAAAGIGGVANQVCGFQVVTPGRFAVRPSPRVRGSSMDDTTLLITVYCLIDNWLGGRR